MASIATVRDGLQTVLATISGLRVSDVVAGQVTPPAAVIRPDTITYSTSQGSATSDMTLVVLLLVSDAVDRVAQDKLDAYLDTSGSSSVLAAVDAAPTLGGSVHAAAVTQMRSYGLVEYAGVTYLGAEIIVEVLTGS